MTGKISKKKKGQCIIIILWPTWKNSLLRRSEEDAKSNKTYCVGFFVAIYDGCRQASYFCLWMWMRIQNPNKKSHIFLAYGKKWPATIHHTTRNDVYAVYCISIRLLLLQPPGGEMYHKKYYRKIHSESQPSQKIYGYMKSNKVFWWGFGSICLQVYFSFILYFWVHHRTNQACFLLGRWEETGIKGEREKWMGKQRLK